MNNVIQSSASSQDLLDRLVEDIRWIRQRSLSRNPLGRTGVIAGQFLILPQEVQSGRPLSRRNLKRFFHFVGRDSQGLREAA